MKATFLTDNMKTVLTSLNHAVSVNSQLEILSTFLLIAEKGRITINATDLEIGMSSSVTASIEEDGSVCVPAKTFLDLINNITEEKISVETEGGSFIVKGKKIKMSFQTQSAREFPALYEDKGQEVAIFNKNTVVKDFEKVVFAASQDASRPALSGIMIKKDGDGLLMVATDGYRLSLKKNIAVKTKNKQILKELLVSAKALKELSLIKQDEDISLFISTKNNQAVFEQGETILVGRLIEAEYPDYEKIIPTVFGTKVEFDRVEMQRAIKLCSVFSRETANIIKILIKKDKIVVSANTPSAGDNMVEVEAKVTGEENEIAFNARYVQDFLANIEEEDISFEMAGPLNPGVLKIVGDDSFLHLIMPIRVQG